MMFPPLSCLFLLFGLPLYFPLCVVGRPANKSQVKISRFQFRKKAIQRQTAEQFKIETAVGQKCDRYEIRFVPVCLDK